jgi:prevent-host-death family protein
MPRTMPASEAGARFDEVLSWLREGGEAVVVERDGEPQAAVVSYDDYQHVVAAQRRQRALAELGRLQDQAGERNRDLSDDQIAGLADRFSREFIEDLAREGKLRFVE